MRLHKVEITLLEVVKHADLHCMKEVGLREVAHNTGIMSKQVKYRVTKVLRVFSIGSLGVDNSERSI